MNIPMLSHLIKQFQTRKEYCNEGTYSDAYGDGTFIHAWLPGIFSNAEIQNIRNGDVIHITQFTQENEAKVKSFTMKILLNKAAYQF